jgi:NADPH:quinone reductase-like Zn-dependent oxidoreductase
LLVGLVGSAGTYAEYVAVSADPPLARVPDDGLDEVVAAALPSGRLHRTRAVVESLEPLGDKTVLIVGAGAGVGYFVTQFAVNAGALVIVNVGTPYGADARIRRHGNCLAGATVRQGRAQCGRSLEALTGARVTRSTSCCTGRANCSRGDAVVGGRIAAPPITRLAFNEAPGLFSAAGNGHADRKTVITLPVSDPVSA